MTTREMSLQEIDAENEIFRISEDLDPPAILDSLREIGQLNPVVLLRQGERKTVVCGFRRVRAMKRLGMLRILVRMVPADYSPVAAFRMALRDNLSHRQLNALEKARVLFGLRHSFGVPDELIVKDYMPLLDLSPAEHVLRSFLLLHRIHPELRKCFAEGRLTHSSIDAIAALAEEVQGCMAFLMGRIHLSASSQKRFLGLLEDLASGTKTRPETLLSSPEILEIADDSRLSPFQRGEKILELLHRRRNPGLSQATDRFQDQLKQFQIPNRVRIRAHPFFEEPGLHVEFDASDPESFREAAAALLQAGNSSEFKNLFTVK